LRFGARAVADAVGCILAHTLRAGPQVLKKGRVLDATDVARLTQGGVETVYVAEPEAGDVDENEAAARIAEALAGERLRVEVTRTGRTNLYATERGLLCVDAGGVERLNRVDESVTLATIERHGLVEAGELVATLKIIPFAVSGQVLQHCLELAAGAAALSIAALRPHRSVLVLTHFESTSERVLERTAARQRERLRLLGAGLAAELRCPHRVDALQTALEEALAKRPDSVLIFGAAAIQDRRDVVPEAIEGVGGELLHFGMPMDPGNLLLLARVGDTAVIGVPGCARSGGPSGFDRVLQRMVAGLETSGEDIMAMGVGGLLRARRGATTAMVAKPRVGAVVLAAGRSSRMGERNKLLSEIEGKALVERVVDALLETEIRPVVVVTGHERAAVEERLCGREVRCVTNERYAEGISQSIGVGVEALESEVLDGAMIVLGDMPWVKAEDFEALVEAFDPESGASICVPVYGDRRGNPVLWAAEFFPELRALSGDVGARALLKLHGARVRRVQCSSDGIVRDVDEPGDLG